MRSLSSMLLVGSVSLLSGCGVGQGLGTPPSEELIAAIADATSTYVVVDLATGTRTLSASLGDLATNPEYRDSKMVFRAVEAGSSLEGSGVADFGHQADETRAIASLARYYIGVFEVTQAQWVRLAATTPWSNLGTTGLSAVGDTRPAHGISLTDARTALSTASARLRATLTLPSDSQWEKACRGGSTGTFSWGDGRDEGTASLFALVAETAAGATGADPVGSRAPNGGGLYDVHGNVWELTSTGTLRGGSWHDSLTQARAANRGPVLDEASSHALVGLRLVLIP